MTNLEALALVVELACQTECRTNDEQRALLIVARKVDAERNVLNNANTGPGQMWAKAEGGYVRQQRESRLEDAAAETRVLEPADGDKPVRLPAKGKRALAYVGLAFVPQADA